MEEEILIVPSGPPETYCRLCFSETNELLLISEYSVQSNQTLMNLIRKYIPVTIRPSQPCAICSTCRMMLEEFDRFREHCVRCDSILMENMAVDHPPAKKQKQAVIAPVQNSTTSPRSMLIIREQDFQVENLQSDTRTNGTSHPTNAGNKSHKCSTCFVSFHFVGSLRRHITETHSKEANNGEPNFDFNSTHTKQSNAVNVELIPASFEQNIYQKEQRTEESALPDCISLEKAEPANRLCSSPIEPSFVPCLIFLERLDAHVIPPIPNLEIPLGKFYHLKQKQKNAVASVEETVEDEIKRIYPSLKLNKPSRVFNCDICFKSMKSRMAYNRHKMRHDDIVFPCTECNRMFPDKSSLDRHMPQHTGEFPHPCDQCPLGFVRIGLLKEHQDRYHGPNAKPLNLFYCSYCPRAFCVQTALSSHILLMHPSQADNG